MFQYGVRGQGGCAVGNGAVASASREGTVSLWKGGMYTWQQAEAFCSSHDPIIAVLDECVAVINGWDTALLLSIKDGSRVACLNHDRICTLGTMPTENGHVLCTGGYDGSVSVWLHYDDPTTWDSDEICSRTTQVNLLLGVAAGRLFVGCTAGGYLWDVFSETCLCVFLTGTNCERIHAAEQLPQHFCAAGSNGTLGLWDTDGNVVAQNDTVHDGQYVQVLRCSGSSGFCSAANDKLFLWHWNPEGGLEHQVTLWGHTAVITRLAFLDDGTVVSSARNGEIIWWDLCNQKEKSLVYCSGEPMGLTQLDNQAVWLLLNGQLAHESTETDVDWKTVVAGIPTVMSGSVALQRFAATILERQRRINSEYRDDDEKLVLTVARQMRLPLQIETVFVMGSSSRGTFVAAPHLDHEAPDLDVGIQLEPGEVNPDELLEALLSDTRSLLIPALNRGYIAVDEGQSPDSVEHSTPSDDNVFANVDLWESERGRFGIKATWFMSRRLSRSIDLIPFRRVGEGSLPQLLLWDGHTRNWVPNNPPLFSHNFQVCSEQNPILPIVTSLVKYWNQIQSVDDAGKAPLKGMHIESLLLEARLPSDLASAFALGLKFCATHVLDPNVGPPGGSIHVGPSYIEKSRRQYVQRLLEGAASLAEYSLECDRREEWKFAVGAWSLLLCESRWQDDGHALVLENPFLEWADKVIW